MIQTKGLTKYYGDFCALSDLTIHVDKGQVFGYIGANGAGKTTTIRILAGLMKQNSGEATVCGCPLPRRARDVKQHVGYLPDASGVYEGLRVEEYLDFFGAAFRMPLRERKKRISYVLDITGAEAFKDKFVETLSRGMKQRLGLARTLLHDPKVLLLDEPLSGLDPKARVEIRDLLQGLCDLGMSALISSHILPELADICDTVGILDHGVLLVSGPMEEVVRGIRRSRVVDLRILDDPQGVAEMLRRLGESAGVTKVELKGSEVRFEWTATDEELADLLSVIVDKGFRLLLFQEAPLSLEEAYLELTGNETGPAEEGAAAGPGDGPGEAAEEPW